MLRIPTKLSCWKRSQPQPNDLIARKLQEQNRYQAQKHEMSSENVTALHKKLIDLRSQIDVVKRRFCRQSLFTRVARRISRESADAEIIFGS
jgi:phage shock protein A